ncbi:hypothetical protein [Actinomadura roseirufa]|uniref:hypothetical protein n=1 Tax=Actinomadura roseirufa TaxID=2094049 RepID=UPI001040EB5E|nr:hypothetical protein [Actinomadura roseirufa]
MTASRSPNVFCSSALTATAGTIPNPVAAGGASPAGHDPLCAGHELRTPLAALRLQLEEALRYPGEVDSHAALTGALTAAERLETAITGLLSRTQGTDEGSCVRLVDRETGIHAPASADERAAVEHRHGRTLHDHVSAAP